MMTSINAPTEPDETKEVYPGLVQEWFLNRQVVVYRLTMVSQTIIDTWADLVVSTVEAWDKSKPYLAMHDLSQPGVSLQYATLVSFDTVNVGVNSKGREAVEAIFDLNDDFFAHVAINFNLSVSGQVNRVLADRRSPHPFVEYRTFYNRGNSLLWLMESLKDDPTQ